MRTTRFGKFIFGMLFLIINFGIIGFQQIKIQKMEKKHNELKEQYDRMEKVLLELRDINIEFLQEMSKWALFK